MQTKLQYLRLFAYSEKNKKYFFTEFESNINIIHGRNTSGKSTLLQLILYAFGINDCNIQLKEILNEEIFIRLDCELTKNDKSEQITFIRENETLFIKREGIPIKSFNGINADNSAEHVKLKNYLHDVFEFTLQLESKNEYKLAPIETMFLPYYVSQAVGWVYLRKSFSSLDFYRNFKDDFLDYYLGIDNFVDRIEKQRLENQKSNILKEITFYTSIENNNEDLQITKIIDEEFINNSKIYIQDYKQKQEEVIKKEKEYILKCNELSYFKERISVLSKVSNNHKKQNPENGSCPVCSQSLPFNIYKSYKYLQENNDTENESVKYKDLIKTTQSKINSLHKEIEEKKEIISNEYELLKKQSKGDITLNSWMKNKANIQLIDNISFKLGERTRELETAKESLGHFKTDEEVLKERGKKSEVFSEIFEGFLKQMGVKELEEDRFTQLFKISAFPSQGVELHKTIMAYHFALNKIIQETESIHRFPFMLDAIFKEDIDAENKETIVKFIGKNRPLDTQTILSISERKGKTNNIAGYNKDHFAGKAKLICIGNGTDERAFLTKYNNENAEFLKETLAMIIGS